MELAEKPTALHRILAGFEKARGAVQLALTICLVVGGYAWSQRIEMTTNATTVENNSAAIRDMKQQMQQDREQNKQNAKEMLTRELYEAYHKTDQQSIEYLRQQNEEVKRMIQDIKNSQ